MVIQPMPWPHRRSFDSVGCRPVRPDLMKLLGMALVLLSGAISLAGWIFFFAGLTSL